MRQRVFQQAGDDSGAITVLVAIGLPVFLGMAALVVDMGMTWQTRRQLQNCADAMALAGAVQLADQLAASSVALDYGFSEDTGCLRTTDPLPEFTFIDLSGDSVADALEVIPRRTVEYGFARALGFVSGTVNARAVAGKVIPGGFIHSEPFGLQVDPDQPCGMAGVTHYTIGGVRLRYGESRTLRLAPLDQDDRSPGNFAAMALGGTGANIYRDNVRDGYGDWLWSCGQAPTETGALIRPTITGLQQRLAGDSEWDTWANCIETDPPIGFRRWSDCPRVIIIPIIEPVGQGHEWMRILTFGFFFIDYFDPHPGANARLIGRFIDVGDRSAPPGEWRAGIPWDPSSSLPFGVKLVE